MYKRIKATKNNSLKKASLMTTVAVLMSFAVLAQERLGLGGTASTSTYAYGYGWGNNWRNNGWWKNRNPWNGAWAYGGYSDDIKLDATESANFGFFKLDTGVIDQLVRERINANGIQSRAFNNASSNTRYSPDGKVFNALMKEIGSWKELKDLGWGSGSFAATESNVRGSASRVQSLADNLLKVQTKLQDVLVQLYTILSLPMMKNPQKLEKATTELTEYYKLSPIVKLADLNNIIQSDAADSGKREEAKDLVARAINCFMNGTLLSEADSNVGGTSVWDSEWESKWVRRSGLNSLYTVLESVLAFNAQIADISKAMIGMKTFRDLVSKVVPFISNIPLGKTEDIKGFLEQGLKKQDFLKAINERYPLLLSLPLVVSSNHKSINEDAAGSAYNLGGLSSIIKSNYENFSSKLIDALRNKSNKNPLDLLNKVVSYVYDNYKSGLKDAGDSNTTISYNFGDKLKECMGSQAVSSVKPLASLDKLREGVVFKRMQAFINGQSADSDKKASTDALEVMKQRFESNTANLFKFETSGYAANQASDMAVIPNSNYGAHFVCYALSLPDALKYRALLMCYAENMNKAARYPHSEWATTNEAWVDANGFLNKARTVLSDLRDQFNNSQDIRSKLQKIKNSEVKKTTDEVSSRSASSSNVSSVITLTGGNLINDTVKSAIVINDNNLTVNVSNLPVAEGEISAVLIPKNIVTNADDEKDKAKKKGSKNDGHRDLPRVSVHNGQATIIAPSDCKVTQGEYELHVREIEKHKDAAGNTTERLKFLYKNKFVVDGSKTEKVSVLEQLSETEDKKDIFDMNKSYLFINDKNEVSFSLKCKDNPASSPIGTPHIVIFEANHGSPNLDKAIHGLQFNSNTHRFTYNTQPLTSGKWEAHIYDGDIAEKNYVGKFVFDTTKKDDSEVITDENNRIKAYLTKNYLESDESTDTFAKKTIKVKLPSEFMYHATDDKVEVEILKANNNNKLLKSETVKLSTESSSRSDSKDVYSLTVSLPKSKDTSVVVRFKSPDLYYCPDMQTNSFKPSEIKKSDVIDTNEHNDSDNIWNSGWGSGWNRGWF